jgi:hypothetical protein
MISVRSSTGCQPPRKSNVANPDLDCWTDEPLAIRSTRRQRNTQSIIPETSNTIPQELPRRGMTRLHMHFLLMERSNSYRKKSTLTC